MSTVNFTRATRRRRGACTSSIKRRAVQLVCGLMVVLGVFGVFGAATAAPITYSVSVDYTNGDQLLGTFDFDAVTDTFSGVNLFLVDTADQVTNTFLFPLGATNGPSVFAFVDSPILTPFVSQFGVISLDGPLTDLGGTFNVVPGGFSSGNSVASFIATCLLNPFSPGDCGLDPNQAVLATGGTVSGAPASQLSLPATASLMLAGLVGLGFVRRRRFAGIFGE